MKVKEGFILREIGGQWVLVPDTDADEDKNCIITLTSSAALLWSELEKGVESIDHLANALLGEYDIDYKTALRDARDFVTQLEENDMLE